MRHRLSPLIAIAALSLPAHADEVKLTDGRVIVGKVKRTPETLEITTRVGLVVVEKTEVDTIRTDKELRVEIRKLARSAGDSAFGHFHVAQAAFDFGLVPQMWEQLDLCIEKLDGKPADPVAKRLADMLAGLEPEVLPGRYREAETKVRVRALVNQIRSHGGPAKHYVVVELLTREADADPHLRELARRAFLPQQRLAVLEAMQRRGNPADQRFVMFRTVLDNDLEVRRGVAKMLKRNQLSDETIARLTPGLLHDAPAIRIRTAEAFANLEDDDAVPILVAHGPLAGLTKAQAGGNFTVRSHMSSIDSRAYVKDFDVEIAQAAAVANPVIGTVNSGIVFDVTVAAVTTQSARIANSYRRALRLLAGSDPGKNPKRWVDWLARHDDQAAAKLRRGS